MTSQIATTAAGRAVLAAAQGGTVGTPVYLRYAFEAPAAESLLRHAADAVVFAAEVLGDPATVYASAVRNAAGQPVQLAIAVRHPDECVALLGVGVAAGTHRPPTYVFLGDRGAIESNAAYSGWVTGGPATADGPADARLTVAAAAISRALDSGRAEPLGGDWTGRHG